MEKPFAILEQRFLKTQKALDERNAVIGEPKGLELPIAIAHDLVNETGLLGMKETAKALKIINNSGKEVGRNGLFKLLRHHQVLKDNNEPYPEYANCFEVKHKQTMQGIKSVTMINSMGLAWLTKLKIENKFDLNCLDEKTRKNNSNSLNIDDVC